MNNNIREISKYLAMLTARKWLLLVVTIAVTAMVVTSGFFLPKRYRADSTVFIEENIIKELVKGLAITTDFQSDLRVLKFALLTRNAVTKALGKVDSSLLPYSGNNVPAKLVEELQARTEISIKGKDLFIVSIQDKNPKFAQQYINALVSTYVEENVFTQREQTYGAERFLDEQVDFFKQKLDAAEDAIVEFRKQQGTYVSLSDSSVLEELRRLTLELEAAKTDLVNLQAKRKSLEGQLATVEKTLPVVTGGTAPRVAPSQLEQRLAILLSKYTEKHPEVVQLRALIEEEKSKNPLASDLDGKPGDIVTYNPVFVDVKQKLMDIESEISFKASQIERIGQNIGAKENVLRNMPEGQKKLRLLEQERESARKIYQEILTRSGQAQISKQMEIGAKTVNFRVVDPAILSNKPVWPNLYMIIFMGVALGLAAGAGTAILIGNLKPLVYSVKDIDGLGVEVLSVVPFVDGVNLKKRFNIENNLYVLAWSLYFLVVAVLSLGVWLWQNNKSIFS